MKFGVINDASKVPLTESNVTEALALQNATNSRPESSKRRPSKTSGETKNALNNDEKENVDSAFVFNVNNRSNVWVIFFRLTTKFVSVHIKINFFGYR